MEDEITKVSTDICVKFWDFPPYTSVEKHIICIKRMKEQYLEIKIEINLLKQEFIFSAQLLLKIPVFELNNHFVFHQTSAVVIGEGQVSWYIF